MIIRSKSYARAGLIGNPSDGYFGKTISFIIRNFHAEVVLFESPELKIQPSKRDHSEFESMTALAQDVRHFGYYGGIRLLKAAIKAFYDHCLRHHIELAGKNFTIRYNTNIPSQVGMAGSSAIITACLRALTTFYGIEIPRHILANLVLAVETEELGIPAGLQDRVIQAYEGAVYMNFDKSLMEARGFGEYVELDTSCLPPLYVAYSSSFAEGTEVFHNDIRGRFNRGDQDVVEAMTFWAELTEQARKLLMSNRGHAIGSLLNQNFDRRHEIFQISERNLKVVEMARALGASCKFTGSGGAFVGTFEDEAMFSRLKETLEPMKIDVLKPQISPPGN